MIKSLRNYLSTIIGHVIPPSRYIIHKKSHPDHNGEYDTEYGCEQLSIKSALLSGLIYKNYERKENQLIHYFL